MFYVSLRSVSNGKMSSNVYTAIHELTVDLLSLSCLCCMYNRWMEACIKEELPAPTELEEGLRNGVLLAKLGNFFAPKVVPLKKIYDLDQGRYKVG